MTLLRQKKVHLINCCNAKYDEDLLIRAMLWYSDKPIASKKKVSLHGCYACVSLGYKKIHIHRLIGLYLCKTKNFPSLVHIHHVNGDKLDNRVENISMVDAHTHISKHQTGRKPSFRCIEKLKENNRKRKGLRTKYHRADVTPFMVYDLYSKGLSFNQISLKLNIDWGCVKQRYNDFIHDNPELLKSF